MALVGMVTLLTAGLLLVARLFKLGFLADFLSRTVLVGFLAGVGVQVATAMLGDMSGVAVNSRYTLVRAWEVVHGLRQPNISTLALSALVAGGILLGNRFAARVPLALIAVVGAIAASWKFDFAHQGIAVIGAVPGGLPMFRLPHVTAGDILALLPVAASCVVVIIAQSAATSRAFCLRYQETVDSDADILGLAAANTVASLSGTFVVNGSPTQTAMADHMGARSQVAQLALAAVVLVVLLALTGPLEYLPRCVLAGIVFAIAVGMIDVARLRAIRRESPGEFYLALTTAATVVALGVEQGILLAMVLSLLRIVQHSYHPHTAVLVEGENGIWRLVPAVRGAVTKPGLVIYRFGAALFYANAGRFSDDVRTLVGPAPSPVHWLVVDAGAITRVDYTAARVVRELQQDLAHRGVSLVLAHVQSDLRPDLDRHGLAELIGPTRIFDSLHEALATFEAGKA